MAEIVFTYDPLVGGKAMGIANLLNRTKQGYPFDHVAMVKDRKTLYESTFRIPEPERKNGQKSGVHKMDFDDWKSYRPGTFLLIYTVPDDFIDFHRLEQYMRTPYDLKAIINILRGKYEKLKKNPEDKIYCSELYAIGRGHKDFYQWSPARAERELSMYQELSKDTGITLRTEWIPSLNPNVVIEGIV